jgi:CRP/FNR family cyclic AMP-dependent transcriptional regulator
MADSPRKVVFVVDDDASIRGLVVKALTVKGYECVEAEDGLKASEILGKMTRLPDLLICDVMMPTIDGFSLARLVKSHKELKGLPIIFLTAKTQPKDLALGMSLGARHYIQKPFSLQELLDKVEKSIR